MFCLTELILAMLDIQKCIYCHIDVNFVVTFNLKKRKVLLLVFCLTELILVMIDIKNVFIVTLM